MKTGAITALAGLMALLALAGPANGQAARGGDDFVLLMTLKVTDGVPEAIKRFRFRKLDVVCDGDLVTEVRAKIQHIRVNDRNRFHKTVERSGRTIRVRGKVSEDQTRIRGTLRVRGDVGLTHQNCDSGRVFWRARLS